jgi:hypothetical protein
VKELIKRLGQSIRWHIRAGVVTKCYVSFLVLVRCVFVVDVNVLCAFMVAILPDYVKSQLVICLKIEQAEVVTNISEFAK